VAPTTKAPPKTILPSCYQAIVGNYYHNPWKWCVREQEEGRNVQSAYDSDSCFCMINKNMTYHQAVRACAMIGGFLTDIQNEEENTMFNTLVNNGADKSVSSPSMSPWIGLKKTSHGRYWYNCLTFIQPGYIQLDEPSEDPTFQSAYTFGINGHWTSINATSTSHHAICRLDRNFYGRRRNPCSLAYFNEK